MSRNHERMPGRRAVALAAACVLGLTMPGCQRDQGSLPTKTMIYGGPAAVVSPAGPSSGPAFAGMGLSIAPEVAPTANAVIHEIRFDVTHQVIQVADTASYIAWTFGGVVPGPVIHIKQGNRIRFTLVNRSDQAAGITFPMPHSMDFHAAMVDPVDKYQSIGPGMQLRYEWTANYPGVFMYHCGTAPVLQHIASGMFGMIIVEPRDGYPTRADREYALIESELYLDRSKTGPRPIDIGAALRKTPTYVAFNGKPNRHVLEPLQAKAGERVRLYVLNAGPNGTSSFHVIGTILDRVWVDGNPANQLRGLQTVLLPASGGAVIEFVVPEPGAYTFVDHEFADATMGAIGRISALP
ncbi:MAG: multicopper oxidase domain-containing protein [Bacteroidota bacterium]